MPTQKKSSIPNKEISGVRVNTILSPLLVLCPGLKPGEDEHQQSAVWSRRMGAEPVGNTVTSTDSTKRFDLTFNNLRMRAERLGK